MDKARIAYTLRSHYPRIIGIRRVLQTIKVKRLFNHVLPKAKIEICEEDPSMKKAIIEPYLIKWKKYLYSSMVEMEDILQNGVLYRDRKDKDKLRTDMMFCKLAYGFIPSEYVCFD